MLTLLILLPLVGAALLLRRPAHQTDAIRLEAALWTFGSALLSVLLYLGYRPTGEPLNFAYAQRIAVAPSLGISYHVGLDGISGLLIMLTGVLGIVSVVCSWSAVVERVKFYYICLLVLIAALFGVFLSLDLFFFYVFFELVLIPMYFLIGLWGGENRLYAAIKFVLYTLVGSLLMLIGLLYIAYSGETHTFNLIELYSKPFEPKAQMLAFAAMALAFGIKVPLFPLHTWLPDAHTEAPTAGSIILAGVLLKMGTYGFLRIAIPLFPGAAVAFAPLIMTLAVIGILYGALVSLVQPDIKKLIAYSSVAHLGFVMLGLFTFNLAGMQGGMIQQINHGVSTGALFLMIGMIYERRHTRLMSDYGGLWTQMPLYSRLYLLTVLASVGLPGLCGFVGEFLVLYGAAQVSMWWAFAGTVGVILAACYLLWMMQKAFYGPVTSDAVRAMPDMSSRELWTLIPLVVLMFWLGLAPNRFLLPAEPDVQYVVDRVTAYKYAQES
ncbi:MAG TPA: Fe-S-binding domain-containing protein, partial [Armatimonadetes bacterium]|nr:Fe-S-binding domain-containing protein [Armatimonadota bacterium]